MDGRTEGAVDLITSIFRLAVADYVGWSYAHDGCAPTRGVRPQHRAGAIDFLTGPWAKYYADLVGLDGSAIWREARRLAESNRPALKGRAA